MFPFGIICQEVMAGWGGWTLGMERQGIQCLEPIELFEDPIKQTSPRARFDISKPEVKAAILEKAAAAPGPAVANFYNISGPCISYSDHSLQNGGTRTWDWPEGHGTKPVGR
ncbi:unnamed protein product [Polarella glacialis]|uniref:DNA (cytosine-5-)-methyltransferase n=1 Tax=Polarella glacialis TaxID=89957 RepID=A0A813K067_POLGL|nr:unnamed protein product [Polarella glacialis]